MFENKANKIVPPQRKSNETPENFAKRLHRYADLMSEIDPQKTSASTWGFEMVNLLPDDDISKMPRVRK